MRGKQAILADLHDLPPSTLAELANSGAKPTDDSAKFKLDPIQARIVAIWKSAAI